MIDSQLSVNRYFFLWLKGLSILLVFLSASAWGVIEVDRLSSPELSERYQRLVAEYRCPKCQNQNLAESNSPISIDLRTEIRRLLEEGNSDEQISNYLVARYGEFVLYRPKVQANTYLLWLAPAALLLLGLGIVIFIIVRQRQALNPSEAQLSDAEREALEVLLQQSDAEENKIADFNKVEKK